MATRMQQRRGTASQWTSANPVLNAGEMGWESDTNKFKIGDGTNHWADLDYFSDINSTVNPAFGSSITFEGATANDFETTLAITDPTADRTITFPDATGTVALTSDITVTASSTTTLSNKSISLGSNTVTSTLAELNTAVSDADVASLAGTETLTNKTLTSPKINENVDLLATSTELNILDGATLSTTELNYVDGVTSAIQTQLNALAPKADPTFTGTVSAASLTLSGDLTVNGTTTTINSTTLSVDDKNIVIGDVETPTDTTADGGGITLKGATDKTFNWVDATDSWTSSEHINLASGKEYSINGTALKDITETLTNKTLTSPKINENVAVTATATELNYVDGVTSAIQTQLDAKASSSTAVTLTGTQTLSNKTFSDNITLSSSGDFSITSSADHIILTPGSGKNVKVGSNVVATIDGTETLTNKTLTSPTLTSALLSNPIFQAPEERWAVSATAATGTIPLDTLTSGILYYTSNATANWTLNVRGSSGATLNNSLTTNDSITVVFFVTNGATPYYQTGFQIDGASVTPKWQNATAPAAGNANSIDIYSFTIVKTGDAAFTAFGSQTRFA
jgi:hypothetical protein